MEKLSPLILALVAVAVLLPVVFGAGNKDKSMISKTMSWNGFKYLLLLCLGVFLPETILHGFFAGVVAVATLLAAWAIHQRISLASVRRSALFGVVILFYILGDWPLTVVLSSASIGLVAWLAWDTFCARTQDNWGDVLPALCWTIGAGWLYTLGYTAETQVVVQLFLGTLSTTLILATLAEKLPRFQAPLAQLTAFVIVVPLVLMLMTSNLFLKPHLTHWGCLLAGGFILNWLLFMLEKDESGETLFSKNIIALLLVGIATLAASRLFGTLGFVFLAVTMLTPLTRRFALLAAVFFLGRTLLQEYLFLHNPNVTGINITHAYASAALFGGITLAMLWPRVLSKVPAGTGSTLIFIIIVAGLAKASNYFLHAEATGSFLVAAFVAGTCVSFLQNENREVAQLTLILPLTLTSFALEAVLLLDWGNAATRMERLGMLVVMTVAVMALIGFIRKRTGNTPLAGSA